MCTVNWNLETNLHQTRCTATTRNWYFSHLGIYDVKELLWWKVQWILL